MRVLHHAPDAWTLFEQDRALFLKVQVTGGKFAYSVLIRLDGAESHEYRLDGRDFIAAYARVIDASMAAGRDSPFHPRDVAALYATRAADALEDFLARPSVPVEPEHRPTETMHAIEVPAPAEPTGPTEPDATPPA
jgi:hypothetical protein